MAPKKATVKKEVEEKKFVIPKMDMKTAKITIEGTTPLLVNNFSEKSKKEIEDKYRQKAKIKAVPISKEEEFKNALYYMPNTKTRYGMPASGLKLCAVSACRYIEGIPMTIALGAFHVLESPYVEIKGKPVVDERTVRVGNFGNKKPANRVRPRFDKWECTFTVQYNAGVISAEQILNLYEHAGFSVGLCEHRPEKKGSNGMFRVKRRI